jgi:hypothetical protein
MGVLAAITTLDKISRSQATYSSVHALVMQELEAIRSIDYTPPNSPYTVGKNTTTQKKSTSISASGDTYMVDVTLVTNYEMVSSGHLVTVVATYETQGRLVTIETTTLINDYSTTS